MNPVSTPGRPALSAMFRMQFEPAQESWVLLYPEGMVRLNTPAAEILKRCDGQRAVDEIVDDLQAAFDGAELRQDVLSFLAEARQRGWVR